jgi:Tfp pilus assembly protein PilX
VLQRLRDESGVALVLALSILLVLTIVFTTVIDLSSADSRDASRTAFSQKAYSLAEAGINDAASLASQILADSSRMPSQPAYAGDQTGSPPAQVVNLPGGTVTWGASWDGSQKIYTIKSIGAVKNPTGPSVSDVTRTITAQVRINPPGYSFVSFNQSCDNHTLLIKLGGKLTVSNAMYINSCSGDVSQGFTHGDAFDIFGSGGQLIDPADIIVHGGWETHNGDTVTIAGVTCPLTTANSTTPGRPDARTSGRGH